MFAYRLALATGWVNVDAMLAAMSGEQLKEWMEFYQLDPWNEERADFRAAIVAHTVAVANGVKRKGGGEIKLKDFMPEFGTQPKAKQPRQTAGQIKSLFNLAFGHLMHRQEKPNG